MTLRHALALALFLIAAQATQAAPSQYESVKHRAAEAKFDGTILIGEADGSFQLLTVGPDAVDADAIWRWASITKQLAAVLAMQEVAKGTIDLDAPISRYWPQWPGKNGATIRIRDLLLHNSGLPQPDTSPADADGIPGFYRANAVTPAAAATGFCAGPPRAGAPAKYEYDNCDSLVLAEVLRLVTGKEFETLVKERLAEPLGLRSLGIYHLDSDRSAHVRPNGEFAELDPLLNLGVYGASGGAYGTIEDLWRFDHALLEGKLLPAEARETMWQSRKDNGFYGFHQWIFPAKLAGCKAETRIVERQGQIAGFEHRNYLLPESGRAVIFFSRHRPANYGDPWEGKGFAYDVLSKVNC